MYDIITIGSATRDAFLVSKEIKLIPSAKFLTGVGECVALGTKIDLDEMVLTTGGGATNAAVTFARLGFFTATSARIGDDYAGQEVLDDLRKDGVAVDLMSVERGGMTGYSTLLTEAKGGERTVLVFRGVSGSWQTKHLPWKQLKSQWIYMTSLGGNIAIARMITQRLGPKTKIAWNPGRAEVKQGLSAFQKMLPSLFLLNMNREEAGMLFKRDVVKLFGTPTIQEIIPPTLTLVITDGSRGAYAYLDGTTWFVKPEPVRVVSRTGAGDAFGSGCVAGLMKGWGIDDALRLGLMNSQSVIQHYGAKAGVLFRWPTRSALRRINVKQL